ncbi:MAG TPA: DHH family phosphoesterase, partial [Clostridiales bacterium]|nr:DHH family phosphoesterase [Clostridiales bacterium]
MSVLVTVAALVLSAVLTGVLFYYNLTAGIIAAVLFLCLLAATVRSYLGRNKRLKQFVEKSGAYFSTQGGKQTYPMPVVVVDEKGLLIWYNRLFEEEMVPEGTLPQDHLSQYLGKVKVQDIAEQKDGYNLAFQNRRYTVYAGCIDTEKSAYVLFFFDDTELKEAAEKYRRSKAVVLQLRIDNLEEIYKNFKNSECEVINGEVETILDEWAGNYPCLFRRISGGGFVMVTEEQSLQKMMESEFSILDKFHDYRYRGNKIAISLSIGVGRGKNLSENDLLSKQALEISQSRGGDQVTVNTDGQLSFFGGTVASTAGSSQVKARMMAATLADHMKAVDVVFTMGHAFSDLDSIGACAGVCAMAKALGKPFYVLCDKPKSMAKSLIDSLENEDGPLAGHFVDRTTVLSLMRGKSTLLVVVDTHRMNSLEYPELLDGFERVAVIDHHRRVAHAMESVVFFYNEPSSSSACEMVTELIQYLPAVVNLPSRTAEALLSGIMLDTRC